MEKTENYTLRYLARIIFEATSPLSIGSGEYNIMTDRLVVTDLNGFPYIPGSTIAGIIKHSMISHFDKNIINKLFGFQLQKHLERKNNEEKDLTATDEYKGLGSRLIFSHANLVGSDGEILEGINLKMTDNEFYERFQFLPIRQHVSISHKGGSITGGKFDEQVVFKGARFCFEIELIGNENDEYVWKKLINQFNTTEFRLGGGTRKGFGVLTVCECKETRINLVEDLNIYLEKTSNLNDPFWNTIESRIIFQKEYDWIRYVLTLTPTDFFLFGSGCGSEDADISYVTEEIIEWKNGRSEFSSKNILIPATSVKGALSHRIAYNFNKANNVFVDKMPTIEELKEKEYFVEFKTINGEDLFQTIVTKGNPAVRSLFGYSAVGDDGKSGNLIISDIYIKESANKKLLNHVAIDRFTGGAMEGALFNEEVIRRKESFELICLVNNNVEQKYMDVLEKTLQELCSCKLPIGGGTMRGHGCFTGTIEISKR